MEGALKAERVFVGFFSSVLSVKILAISSQKST